MTKILAWSVVFIAAIWTIEAPDFEPIVAFVASLLTAITLQVKKSNDKQETEASPTIEESDNTFEVAEEEKTPEVNPVFKLAERFLEVFESHGVHLNEIPRCIPEKFGISLVELANKDKLIEKLTPDLIDWFCSIFNIRRDWLEANGNYIYDTKNYYKNEHSLLRLLKDLKEQHHSSMRVIAYKDVKELDSGGERPQDVNLLIVIPAFKIDDRLVMKYIPTSTQWDWGYWRSRYQFKGITRVCYKKLDLTFDGYNLDSEKMAELSSGGVFPKLIIDETPMGYTWYPDDYTDKETESRCAKETHENRSILDYIDEQRYADVFTDNA
ncbi:hypothetical protein [Shewanella woodyi]|uniref:Uncharacterized protein n=1 Tax=Shewanella woodyi (strain ATCC 51908 / MS32) TaxID=392500 RepID=B1KM01_SHEWM|nr:hypothetical protein [Shewanella woodyi]ACA88881.1 hypothetical protein Swoo_4631 [Shewanella woodyi ATCC 51908]